MKAGLNNIHFFNGFAIYDYINYKLNKLNLCESNKDFDYGEYDQIYCAVVVKLLML